MNSPRNAVGALEEEMRQGWLRNGGFAQGRAQSWLCSAAVAQLSTSSPLLIPHIPICRGSSSFSCGVLAFLL